MDVPEDTSGATGMQQRHKGPRPERAATSRKQEGIQQDPRTNHQAGDREAHRWIFREALKNKW
jgi:hypothetical protein